MPPPPLCSNRRARIPRVRSDANSGLCRYEQLTIRANALREELHTEITRMLNDVIKFKMHVQKSLEDYEGFVTDELERELASEELPEEAQRVDE